MTKPLRAENQPRAARYQPRDPPPDEDEPVHAGIQARLNAHPGLRAQDQARPADFNMDYGDYFRAKEQPKAFTNNFATDNARVLNGNVCVMHLNVDVQPAGLLDKCSIFA